MPQPPFNLFSQHLNPEGALARLRELLPNEDVFVQPGGDWERITGTWKRGWLKRALKLTVTHSRDYYSDESWDVQRVGMARYLGRFPRSGERPDLTGYVLGLSFCLSFIFDPDFIEEDPRLEVIFEMARFLDGVIFLPSCLLDSQGRTIVSEDGEIDPEATLPVHVPVAGDLAEFNDDEGDGDESTEPPALERVLARFHLLVALVERGLFEEGPENQGDARRVALISELNQSGAWTEAEDWEREAMETSVGNLDQKLQWKLPWLSEGAAVLAWALRRIDLPAYDEQVSVEDLFRIRDDLRMRGDLIGLRPVEEMKTLSCQMLAIHWRLRQYYLERKPMDLIEFAPRAWWGQMDLGLARLIDNDLEVNGCPISRAPEEAWGCACGIMEERRVAIRWLTGCEAIYSAVDTST